jgi:hypothetical protein
MAEPPRKRHLSAEQRRALRLLASSPFGVSKAVMVANGFKARCYPNSSALGLQQHSVRLRLAANLSAGSGSLRPVDARSKVEPSARPSPRLP